MAAGVDSKAKEQLLTERLASLEQDAISLLSEPKAYYSINEIFGRIFITDRRNVVVNASAIPAPEVVIEPGTTVWVPVTPTTHNCIVGGFHPLPFFILETVVLSVEWMQRSSEYGHLWYRLDSSYSEDNVDDLCRTKEAAVARLCAAIEAVVPAKAEPSRITVFTREAEQAHKKAMIDRICGNTVAMPKEA